MMRNAIVRLFLSASVVFAVIATGCAARRDVSVASAELEDIYVLRSIREQRAPAVNGCTAATTGFDPFTTDADRFFTFWSVTARPDGRVIDAKRARVAELRGCFGPTHDRTRQNFYAEIRLDAIAFRGRGECVAFSIDEPQTGLFPVRCHLILSDLPAPFVGGVLTTNTLTSSASFGGDTDPPGYTQASIATIRLWKQKGAQP